LAANSTGAQSVAVGSFALNDNTTGGYNTAIGNYALAVSTTANTCVAIGYESLVANTTGSDNVGIGVDSLKANTTASDNTAVGRSALTANTTGYAVTAVGKFALSGNTTGVRNTALGFQAGDNTSSASDNISIGYQARPSSSSVSDQCTLGNAAITDLRCNDTSISSLSDSRDKTNIVDIPLGLSFINTVRPVAFDWDRRDGSFEGRKDFGFIAQELKTAADATDYADHMRLVHDENPDKLEADPMKMFPILVKAIQELKAENDALKTRVTTLEG